MDPPSPYLSRDVGDPQVTLLPWSVVRSPLHRFLVLPGGVRWKFRQSVHSAPTTAECRHREPLGLPTQALFPWLGFKQSALTIDGLADQQLVRAPRTNLAL